MSIKPIKLYITYLHCKSAFIRLQSNMAFWLSTSLEKQIQHIYRTAFSTSLYQLYQLNGLDTIIENGKTVQDNNNNLQTDKLNYLINVILCKTWCDCVQLNHRDMIPLMLIKIHY